MNADSAAIVGTFLVFGALFLLALCQVAPPV